MTWPPPSIDPLIRRTPPPGTQAERPAPERPQPGPRPATHRKPVARFGRISSVALSMAATGGLTWSFAQADHDSEADARVEPTASNPTAATPGATASPSTEATETVVVFAAEWLPDHVVEAVIRPGHEASIRTAEAAGLLFYARQGFVEVGRIPGGIRVGAGDDRDDVEMVRRADGSPLVADGRR